MEKLRKEFDEYMMSNMKPFTPDNVFEWFSTKINEINNKKNDPLKLSDSEPSELKQLIWRIVVDTFNSKSTSPTDIYHRIIKDENESINVIEQIARAGGN